MSEGSHTEEFGPYTVYEQLGVGGMAHVHRATSQEFPRPVALKRMLSHLATNEDMVKSFVREARLAAYLRHENVAQTYDLGRVGDVYFIVMELITGRNLRAVLRHCGATTGPMPVHLVLNILNQVCNALDYAHNLCDEHGQPLGIIHRDVSPSNVIVSDSGVVKLIDFGIAKASGAGMQTMSGTLKGKFAYMAPEYIAGRLDARADLFAVGVIAHELLTNRPLFTGRDDIDTLTRVRDMPIDPPSKKNSLVPPEIDDIVMTALARDPERRWQHATALRSALTTLTERLGLVATNAQLVQWLDWAFSHARKAPGGEPDTETDAEAIIEEPSISIEQCTAERPPPTQRIAVVSPGAMPEPPSLPRAGTPGQLPIPAPISVRLPTVRNGRYARLVPRATTNTTSRSLARAPTAQPRTPASPLSAQLDGPAHNAPTVPLPTIPMVAAPAEPPPGLKGSAPNIHIPAAAPAPRLAPSAPPPVPTGPTTRPPPSFRPLAPSAHVPMPPPMGARAAVALPAAVTAVPTLLAPVSHEAPTTLDVVPLHNLEPATPSTDVPAPPPLGALASPSAPTLYDVSAPSLAAAQSSLAAPSAPTQRDVPGPNLHVPVPPPLSSFLTPAPPTVRDAQAPGFAVSSHAAPTMFHSPGPSFPAPSFPAPSGHVPAAPSGRLATGSASPSFHGAPAQGSPSPPFQLVPLPAAPAFQAAPGVPSFYAPPVPVIPSFNAAPFAAPRPSSPAQHLHCDPALSAVVRREFEQRVSASSRVVVNPPPARIRSILGIGLVVLAAAIAAITVYLVLPL